MGDRSTKVVAGRGGAADAVGVTASRLSPTSTRLRAIAADFVVAVCVGASNACGAGSGKSGRLWLSGGRSIAERRTADGSAGGVLSGFRIRLSSVGRATSSFGGVTSHTAVRSRLGTSDLRVTRASGAGRRTSIGCSASSGPRSTVRVAIVGFDSVSTEDGRRATVNAGVAGRSTLVNSPRI